ncbi:hypothetical protein ACGGZK_01690 [Agromyces sp. MMS24-K17]|uniref:hypothetical protein n=1 Tax=Agromyces sp. MMS24-K17 TaxID=3372850 RepID=UPI0037541A5E
MPALDLFGLVVEVLSWVGLGAGLLLLIAALFARAADSGWSEVHVVVVPGADGESTARWFAGGDLHERPLDEHDMHAIADLESATGWANGGRLRFERRSGASRVLGLLAIILLSVGLVATVLSLVLSLTAG